MKRWTIAVVMLLAMLAGCAGNAKPDATEAPEMDDMSINADKDSVKVKVEDGAEIEVANEGAKSLELPEDYPVDLLPLYSDEFILTVQKNQDGSYALVGLTNATIEEVKAFYTDFLADTTTVMNTQDVDYFMTMGDNKGSAYTVMVEPNEDEAYPYSTLYVLSINPGQALVEETSDEQTEETTASEATSESVEAPLVLPEGQTMPKTYPADVLPMYNTGAAEAASANDGMIAFMTEDPIDRVTDYYKNALKEAADYTVMDMQPAAMISGTLDGHFIQVMIGPNEGQEDERFKTLIQVMYQ